MSADAARELEAIDSVLSGEQVPQGDATLAQLVHELRATRLRPSQEFVDALDARAAGGFRDGRAGGRTAPPGARSRALLPLRSKTWSAPHVAAALGVLATALVAIAVAVPLALSGSDHRRAATAPPAEIRGLKEAAQLRTPKASASGGVAGETAPLAPMSRSAAAASVAAPNAPAASARQVERTATLDVGVAPNAIESTSQQVFTLVSIRGGYVRQSNVTSGGAGQGGASFDLRIPSSNLGAAIAELSHLGHVRSENDTTNDVTDQVNALQRSIDDLRAERASLLRQLAATSDPERSATLKAHLQSTERLLSQTLGQLGALQGRIAYTALALSLTAETPAPAAQGDFTPGQAAKDAAQILQAALAVAVLAAAALMPIGALAGAAWLLIASSRRRMREHALDAS